MPKVSVVIPTYNVEGYLRECLDSVVNQTLKDIEIICVNDGSTDSSLQIIQEYAAKDDRIKVIDKPNSGYGHSMNLGMDNATGEYLGIVEPDDYVELNMYETLYNKAKELDLDFIKSDFCRFVGDSENRKFTYNRLDRTGNYYNKIVNIQDDLKPFKFIMNTWCGIYNLSFLRKYDIRHNETPGASFQDNGFWFQTFMNSTKAYFLDQPFYMNRRDNPNSSVNNKAKVYCMCEEYDYIRSIIDKNSDFEKFIPIYQYKRYCNYLFTLNRIDKKFKKEFIKKFSKDFKLAMRNNEIDKSLYGDREYQNLELIINKPDKFYRKYLQKLSLFEKIFSVKNKGIHKIIRILGVKIKFKNKKLIEKQKQFELQENINNQNKKIKENKKELNCIKNQVMLAIKRCTPQPELKSIAVHLVDHCNLRCCGCDHFAPLAEKRFEDITVFENDIKRFAELSDAKLGILKLMGGEPLLHPQLIDFMRISRQYLSETRIEIVTNAILLNLQKEDFWLACNKYNIVIVPTKYPLKTNYKKAEQTATKYGVKLEYYGNTNEVLKTSYHIPLDIEGKQDPANNFINCFHANNCVFLKQGKLYTCTVAPNICHFNNFFDKNIPLSEKDGIDIHKAQNIDELLAFLAKPIPFCKYCNVNGRTFGHEWGISKKEIEEWI